jgi:hypothetical protein
MRFIPPLHVLPPLGAAEVRPVPASGRLRLLRAGWMRPMGLLQPNSVNQAATASVVLCAVPDSE